ncbi:MAG: FRG domain-containing protein [Verrucomicrobiales bacterium]|nr:FRG domain-containing protein [Verrucomicrobiales bacterium]
MTHEAWDPQRTVTIESLSDITSWIERTYPGPSTVFFRGQGADRPLLPSLARLRPRRAGLDLLATEQKLLRAFQRRSLPFLEMRPETIWDWLAVAQHHGLPTRLLDWSVNALSAVWFAVERPAKAADDPKRRGVVWAFATREGPVEEGGDFVSGTRNDEPSRAFSLGRSCVLVPRYVSKRIVAQGGYFTVQASLPKVPYFVGLEQEMAFADRLWKLVIPAERFPAIRHQLTRMGTNAMSIYPDLVGLCRDIKWRYALADDEVAAEPGQA